MNVTSVYVAVHPTCGHVRAVMCVDENDPSDLADGAKEAKAWVKRGLKFERRLPDPPLVLGASCAACKRK